MAGMRRSITFAIFCSGLAALIFLGCQNPNEEWYGVWEGDLQRTDPAKPDDDRKRTIDLLLVTIRRDGTFEMEESGMLKTGTVRIVDGKAFLTIKRIMNRPIQQLGSGAEKMNLDLTAEIQEDGTMLFRDPGGFDDRYITLVRRAQP